MPKPCLAPALCVGWVIACVLCIASASDHSQVSQPPRWAAAAHVAAVLAACELQQLWRRQQLALHCGSNAAMQALVAVGCCASLPDFPQGLMQPQVTQKGPLG